LIFRFTKKILIIVCLVIIISSSVFAGPMDDLLINGVQNNDMYIIKMALANGANINYIKYDSDTPLLVAVRKNNFALVDYLLKNGADANFRTKNITPLGEATRLKKDLKIIKNLVNYSADINSLSDGCSPLWNAVSNPPNIEVIKYFLSKNVDVNQASENGRTPLMIVAQYENGWDEGYAQQKIMAAKLLLKAGADPSMVNKRGNTALQYAIDSNFNQMINLLLPISPK
jgi:ankyrin repeat protein